MRRRILFLGLVVSLCICSLVACGSKEDELVKETTENVTEEVTESEPTATPSPEPTAEPTNEPIPETETIYVTSKEITYDGDGNVSSVTTYEYDEYGNMTVMNTDGRFSSRTEYKYEYDENGNIAKCVILDEDGLIVNISTYEYDAAGNQIKEGYKNESLGSEGEEISEYDTDNNLIKTTDYDEDGTIIETYLYEYDNDMLIKFGSYNADGSLNWDSIYEYDSDGRVIKEVGSISIDGVIYSSKGEHEYDADGHLLKTYFYDGDELMYWEEYENNENGKRKKCTRIGADGSIYNIEETEYIELEVKKAGHKR